MGVGETSYDLMRLIYGNCHRYHNNIHTEDGEFVCNIPEGLKFLHTYLETFVHPEFEHHYPELQTYFQYLPSSISTDIIHTRKTYNLLSIHENR